MLDGGVRVKMSTEQFIPLILKTYYIVIRAFISNLKTFKFSFLFRYSTK